jgi:hypothetical protein
LVTSQPYATTLANDDEALREQQLARLCLLATMVDAALQIGVREINQIQVDDSGWCDASGRFAVLPVSMQVTCPYLSAEALLTRLSRGSDGIGLHAVTWERSGNDYQLGLSARIVVPKPESWQLDELPEAGAPATKASGRRPSRRRTR